MSRDALDIEMTPAGGETGARKGKEYVKEKLANAVGDNGWKTTVILIAVLLANVFAEYAINTARGGFLGSQNSVAVTIGAVNAGLYFAFGYFYMRVYFDPIHTLLNMCLFDEPVGRGLVVIVVMFVGKILGSLLAHAQIGYARFENVAVVPNPSFSTFQAFLVEMLLGFVIYITLIGFSALAKKRELALPTSSIIFGIVAYFCQAVSYPISGASLNLFHWLCTNIVGTLGDNTVFWTHNWYIYILSPFAGAGAAYAFFVVMKYMITKASAQASSKNY